MATITRYVNTDSTAGGDGTTNATAGANRAYASINEWEAAEQADLVTAGDIHEVECSGSAVDTASFIVAGWTTGAANYIRIYAADGSRCNGVSRDKTAGIYQVANGTNVQEEYVRYEGLEFKESTDSIFDFGSSLAASNDIRITDCLVWTTAATSNFYTINAAVTNLKLTITNTLIYSNTRGIDSRNSGSLTMDHCVLFTDSGDFGTVTANEGTITNTYAGGYSNECFWTVGTNPSGTHNSSSDTTATAFTGDTTNSLNSKAAASQFTNPTVVGSTADFSLLTSGDLDGAGTGSLTNDIAGTAYPSPSDIGAFSSFVASTDATFHLPPEFLEPALLTPGQKPTGAVEVDRTHPIGAKCKAVYLGGREVIGQKPSRIIENGAIEYNPPLVSIDGEASGEYLQFESPVSGASEMTAIVRHRHNSGDTYAAYIATDQNYNNSFFLGRDAGAMQAFVGTKKIDSGGVSPSTTTMQTHALTFKGSTSMEYYIDGVSVASSTTSIPATVGTHSYVRLANNADVFASNGDLDYAMVFDKRLSDEEIADLYRNPYQFLKPQAPRVMYSLAAATTSQPFVIPDIRWEMPDLLIPGRKPVGRVVVDEGHPLARGVFLEQPIIQGDTQNLLSRAGTLATNGATIDPVSASISAGTNYVRCGDNFPTSRLNTSQECTFMLVMEITATPSGTWGAGGITGGTFGGSAAHIGIKGFSTTQLILSGREDFKETVTVADTGFTWTVGEKRVIVGTIKSGEQKLYADGVEVASTSTSLTWDWDLFASWGIGTVWNYEWVANAVSGPVKVHAMRAFDRVLNPAEVASLTRHYYQFLIPA